MRMKKVKNQFAMLLMIAASASCEIVDNDLTKPVSDHDDNPKVALKDVASVLAYTPVLVLWCI